MVIAALAVEHSADVIAVMRGGGRTMILRPSTPRVLLGRSLVLPAITGLGHEIGTTIADEVAHTAGKNSPMRGG